MHASETLQHDTIAATGLSLIPMAIFHILLTAYHRSGSLLTHAATAALLTHAAEASA